MKAALVFTLAGILPLAAQSTIAPAQAHAYSSNAGWLNFRPSATDGVVVQEQFLSGYSYAANIGWLHFGDGTPANGFSYSQSSASDCGVNHDGAGNLSGYAYSANIGWISFQWAAAGNANRPRIDLTTGAFSGYAYSANLGWIALGGGYLKTATILYQDGDGDGITDSWEYEHFSSISTANSTTDADNDGVADAKEYLSDTDPLNAADTLRILTQDPNPEANTNQLRITTAPTRLYRIEFQNALNPAGWTDSTLGTFAPDSGTNTLRTISYPGGSKYFFRAVAIKPLAP